MIFAKLKVYIFFGYKVKSILIISIFFLSFTRKTLTILSSNLILSKPSFPYPPNSQTKLKINTIFKVKKHNLLLNIFFPIIKYLYKI